MTSRVGARSERLFGVVIHEIDDAGRTWSARWHRKGRTAAHRSGRRLSWAVAVLFLVGSALFVVAGIGAFGDLDWVATLNLIGATLFSIGAIVAVVEARSALIARGQTGSPSDLWRDPGGRAALIQLPSAAVFFQTAMIAGTLRQLGWIGLDVLLWTPSTIGSIGFVAASWIAWSESRPAHDIGTAVAAANLAGSMGFLLGSLAGYADEPPFGISANAVTNPVFLAGSLFFLLGSGLACRELTSPDPTAG